MLSSANTSAELDLYDAVAAPVTATGISTLIDDAITTAPVTVTGGSGNNLFTLVGSAPADSTIVPVTVTGGTGNNDFVFSGTGSTSAAIITPSGSGPTTADFSQLEFGTGVNVNLADTGPQTVATSSTGATLILDLSQASIQQLDGTPLADTLTGGSGTVAINGEGGDDTLEAGSGNTTFQFIGTPSGTVSIIAHSPANGGGSNTLDFSSLNAGASVDLGNTGVQSVYSDSTGNLNLNLSQAVEGIGTIVGSSSSTITGNTVGTTFVAGPGNESFIATGANNTFTNLNTSGTGVLTDTVTFPTGVPTAEGLMPSLGQIYAGDSATFSLLNPTVASGTAYYSFATTLAGLATSITGLSTVNQSPVFTFASPDTPYTAWGRVFDANGNDTTFEYAFTTPSLAAALVTKNGLAIDGATLVSPSTGSSTFSYSLTLVNNGNVPTSQWVVYWGDGSVCDYNVSPTSSAPVTVTHVYDNMAASTVYQITANVVDTSNNLTVLDPVTVGVLANGPLLAPPTGLVLTDEGWGTTPPSGYSVYFGWTNPNVGPDSNQLITGTTSSFLQMGLTSGPVQIR